jgi:Tol biopolymer transport system component
MAAVMVLAGSPAGAVGAAAGATVRVSVSTTGAQGDYYADGPALSGNGRSVAFHASSTNLVPGATNGVEDVFVRDRRSGVTRRVSVSDTEAQASSATPTFGSSYPGISADGRWVTFVSGASNLVRGDTNVVEDAFVRDRRRGTTTRISVPTRRAQADGYSYQTKINASGRYVVFGSAASNLVPGDTNAEQDVFVHDLRTGRTTRESVAARGAQANSACLEPAISADGRHVGFMSWASNLIQGDTNEAADVFVRDRR